MYVYCSPQFPCAVSSRLHLIFHCTSVTSLPDTQSKKTIIPYAIRGPLSIILRKFFSCTQNDSHLLWASDMRKTPIFADVVPHTDKVLSARFGSLRSLTARAADYVNHSSAVICCDRRHDHVTCARCVCSGNLLTFQVWTKYTAYTFSF